MSNWCFLGRGAALRGNAGAPIAAAPAPSPSPSPSPTPTPSAFDITKTDATTQARYATIKTTPFAGQWAGYLGEAFYNDTTVANDTQWDAAYAAARTNAQNGRWQVIRVSPGTTRLYMDDADFKPYNGGGLLVVPASGAVMDYTGKIINSFGGNPRGVQIGLNTTSTFRLMDTTAAANGQIRINRPISSNYAVVRLVGLQGGLIYQGVAADSAALRDDQWTAVLAFYAQDLAIVDCSFKGFQFGLNLYGCRLVLVDNVDFQQNVQDCIGYSTFSGADERKGIFADDHSYVLLRNVTTRNQHDQYQYSPPSSGGHSDCAQLRTTVSYPGSGVPISAGKWVSVGGNLYKTTAGGTTGTGTPPSGTGASITDGSVTWSYVGPTATGPATYMVMENVCNLSAAVDYADLGGVRYAAGQQLHINSDSVQRTGLLVLNTLHASRSQYGVQTGGAALEFCDVWYSSLTGTCEIPPSGGLTVGFPPSVFSNSDTFPAGAIRVSKSILAGVVPSATAVTEIDNIHVDPRAIAVAPNRPPDKLAGPFTANADGYWLFSYTDDGTRTQAQFRSDMYARLKMANGSDYGASF
jgi:hypothetical protein